MTSMERSTNPENLPLLDALGIKPAFVDDEGISGPPVDPEKIRRYVRRELDPHATHEVRDCICAFRSWYQALTDIIRSEPT